MAKFPPYMGIEPPDVANWLAHFALHLPDYAPEMGITDDDVTYFLAGAAYYRWLAMTCLTELRQSAEGATQARNEFGMSDDQSDFMMSPPILTPPPVSPVVLRRGFLRWTDRLVKRIRLAKGYDEVVGETLQILPVSRAARPAKATRINLKSLANYAVRIKSTRLGAPSVLYYDMADPRQPVLLAAIPSATWTDERPPLVPNQPQSRSYAVRYGDAQGKPLPNSLLSDIATIVTHA